MKLTQKKCRIILPKTKSANALITTPKSADCSIIFGGMRHSKRSPHIPFHRYPLEFGLVLGVRLHAQTSCEYELADRRRESGEEGVERLKLILRARQFTMSHSILVSSCVVCPYIVSRHDAIGELQHAYHDQEAHESIQELDPLRRVLDVVIPHPERNLLHVICVADRCRAGRFVLVSGGLRMGGRGGASGRFHRGGRHRGRGRLLGGCFLGCHCARTTRERQRKEKKRKAVTGKLSK